MRHIEGNGATEIMPFPKNLFLNPYNALPPFNKLKDVCMCFNQFYLRIGKIFQFLGFWCRRNL